ncbi:hypothetical protein [Duncaniella muris]|uniref:hypothetical protein n=1 Tax=Duncaniella muris TaxID=2094150 RepID=UPI003F672268
MHRCSPIAAIGAGYGIGQYRWIRHGTIARQPESTGDIRSNMIVIAPLSKVWALFAVIVCIFAMFVADLQGFIYLKNGTFITPDFGLIFWMFRVVRPSLSSSCGSGAARDHERSV